MKILFVGGVIPKDKEEEIYSQSIGSIQNAANLLQWNIIKGIEDNNNKILQILNAPFIGNYPKGFKKILIKNYNWSHIKDADDYSISFINILGIKNITREVSLRNKIKHWAQETLGEKEKCIIIGYALHGPILAAIKEAKKINSQIKTCIIIPDLPEYMNVTNTSWLYKMMKKIDIRRINKNLNYVDGIVALTKSMVKKLKRENRPYLILEGIYNLSQEKKIDTKCTSNTIVYTGILNERYGIKDLVDAFDYIEEQNYKLVLCGAGDCVEYILDKAKKDNRIVYKGELTHKDAKYEQEQAKVLINPRSNNEEYTKFSFPSKTIEYLATGKPLIMFKLDGIPEEYDIYINYIDYEGAQGIASKIKQICEKEDIELIVRGQNAKKFIIEHKNNIVQTRKILEMIDNL